MESRGNCDITVVLYGWVAIVSTVCVLRWVELEVAADTELILTQWSDYLEISGVTERRRLVKLLLPVGQRELWTLPSSWLSWLSWSSRHEIVCCTLSLSVVSVAHRRVLKGRLHHQPVEPLNPLSVCCDPLSWAAVFTGVFRWARTYWSYCETNVFLCKLLIINCRKS